MFYFAPQGLWYLVYQTGNASYSTNPDISNPNGWSAPQELLLQRCRRSSSRTSATATGSTCGSSATAAKCYLFSSDDNGHLYRSETTVANFPNGMTNTVIALQDCNRNNLFEAANVYKVAGRNQYLLIVEAIGSDGRRYFRSWTSSAPRRAAGPLWPPVRATRSPARTTSPSSGSSWTTDISHGEMIRSGTVDQTLTISPCRMQYLYQGKDPSAGGDYNSLPWRLGLLTQTNSTC